MNWKDILKAEIQVIPSATTADGDVNIDLEDDDCIRWVKKLVELFGELYTTNDGLTTYEGHDLNSEYFKEDLLTEEMACEFKKLVNTGKVDELYKERIIPTVGLQGDSSLQSRNAYVFFDMTYEKQLSLTKKPTIRIDLTFILTANPDSVLSLARVGYLDDTISFSNFERQIKKICRHCSWQPTGLNKFFTMFRNDYYNDNVEKTTGAVTTSSPSAVSGKLFNISYGGKKRGKKRQSKKEDY